MGCGGGGRGNMPWGRGQRRGGEGARGRGEKGGLGGRGLRARGRLTAHPHGSLHFGLEEGLDRELLLRPGVGGRQGGFFGFLAGAGGVAAERGGDRARHGPRPYPYPCRAVLRVRRSISICLRFRPLGSHAALPPALSLSSRLRQGPCDRAVFLVFYSGGGRRVERHLTPVVVVHMTVAVARVFLRMDMINNKGKKE